MFKESEFRSSIQKANLGRYAFRKTSVGEVDSVQRQKRFEVRIIKSILLRLKRTNNVNGVYHG